MDVRLTLLLILGVSLSAATTVNKHKRTVEKLMAKRYGTSYSSGSASGGGDLCDIIDVNSPPSWAFVCDQGTTCLFSTSRCDGEPDCADKSDENADCDLALGADLCQKIDQNGVVPHWMSVCKDQAFCIFRDWECDGEQDCFDGSDEAGCPREDPCSGIGPKDVLPPSVKRCKNGKGCVLTKHLCDKIEDCEDGSDENVEKCSEQWTNLGGGYRPSRK